MYSVRDWLWPWNVLPFRTFDKTVEITNHVRFSTFNVTQCHCYWRHSIGHIRFRITLPELCIYLVPFWDVITYFPKFKDVTVTLKTSPSITCLLVLISISLYVKSDVPGFTHFKDMIKAQKFKNSLHDPSCSRVIFHPWARTCCKQQI